MKPRTTERMLVSILNWNHTADTLNCLEVLCREHTSALRLVVLDNGSLVDPVPEISARFPHVDALRVPHNLGFTGGHNLVMQMALDQGYEAVMLLNNDCQMSASELLALLHALDADPKLGAASAVIYRRQDPGIPMMVAGHIDWARHRSVRPNDPATQQPADSPTLLVGTALALRVTALREIGLLDGRYFAYYEDNELSARFHAAGWRVAYVTQAVCLHDHKPLPAYSPMAMYLLQRNAWLFWRQHTPARHRRGLKRHLLAQALFDLCTLRSSQARPELEYAFFAGLWDGVRGRSGPPPSRHSRPPWFAALLRAVPFRAVRLLERIAP